MALTVNRVELIGNLGRDPEVRATQAGKQIANLSIATSESWKDAHTGEWRERSEWHRVVIFNEGLAKIAEKHLEKGMKVRIEGKLRTRKWQDPSGQERYSTEVHVEAFDGSLNFDMKKNGERAAGGHAAAREPTSPTSGEPSWDVPKSGDLDTEIPY